MLINKQFLLPAVLLACATLVAASSPAWAADTTWPEAMHTARTAFQKQRESTPVTLGPWYSTAPLKGKSFSDPLAPEQGIDLNAKGADGKPLWNKSDQYVDGKVHTIKGANSASTYLYRTITAASAAELNAHFGSDDGLIVWLNGQRILTRDVPRGVSANQDHAALKLVAGDNKLLMKIYNRTGGHGFYFASDHDPRPMLWREVEKKFPREAASFKRDLPDNGYLRWFEQGKSVDFEKKAIESALAELNAAGNGVKEKYDALCSGPAAPGDPKWLSLYASTIADRETLRTARAEFGQIKLDALARSVRHLAKTYPATYVNAKEYLKRLADYEANQSKLKAGLDQGDVKQAAQVKEILAFQRNALMENPLLDFDKLLLIRRKGHHGLPQNWQGNCSLPRSGYDNEIAVLSPVAPEGKLTTVYKPEEKAFVGDVDLHYDADRLLFSSTDSAKRWQIYEVKTDGSGLRQVTPSKYPDVDNYDACYLPNGKIMFDSTRVFQGIPCVGGSDTVANLHVMDADGANVRQLCFDQDHDWCPTVLNNGRVMYTRWEYSDTPHYFTRILFSMNPDGTNQMEYYGSNSFWPNSMFYARPIPGHPTKVVAIVSGHHGIARMGELTILDPAKGRHEANGAIQRIPESGKKVEPTIADQLVANSWPRFLHPFPLSDTYFLVSCQPTPQHNWGIYLVDTFDNMTLLHEMPGHFLFEPVPVRKTEKQPVVPERVQPDQKDATIYLADIYAGGGLKDVPRGTVKKLRLYEFHYAYPKMGGHAHIAVEGTWDVHRILGTVPVLSDGSAVFKVPANMPIAVQPLDAEGKALQVMRSWFTAMPGEVLSCVGCHEKQNTGPPSRQTLAARTRPLEIEQWRGPVRGFSFKRDVQPVLDKNCVGCHSGKNAMIPDFSPKEKNGWSNFTPAYLALHPYVRRPGPESDYHLQEPLEWHADTSELIQMLKKGHKNVKLSDEDWDRLITWIDLNVPDHGTWAEHRAIAPNMHKRRLEMRTLYAGRPEDPEVIPAVYTKPAAFVAPKPAPVRPAGDTECPGWPFEAASAKALQKAVGKPEEMALDLGNGLTMKMRLIPAGEFIMGDQTGPGDECPQKRVAIDKPFYMGTLEVTNAQYAVFDPEHDTGFINQNSKDHTTRGYPANEPEMPVTRISWAQAVEFCKWLTEKTGHNCSLPTEAQWEWACRAGANTPFYFGAMDSDFSTFANLADISTKRLAVAGINPQPINNPNDYQAWLPRNNTYDDKERIVTATGKYGANAWGLHDMHGNVAEWTLTNYAPYPYVESDGRNDLSLSADKVARGGSWRDRPKRARASFRLPYRPYQRVFNVGFRVVCEAK